MDRYKDIKSRLLKYAHSDEDIKAVVAIGSSTREFTPADEFSDLDLIIATSSPERWFSGEYPALLGNVSISFIEPTLGGGMERRCIYDADRDVDMIIFSPEQFEAAITDGTMKIVMNRGYNVLYDSQGYTELIGQYVRLGTSAPAMNEDRFINTVNDFYFHCIWAYKKLKRGELWSAKMCVDSYLKSRLLKMIEVYCSLTGADVWHDGRFIDRWADEEILSQLRQCFAHYDKGDILRALRETHELFHMAAKAYAGAVGFDYPEGAKKCAEDYIFEVDENDS